MLLVCLKKMIPEKKLTRKTGFHSTESGGGEQVLPQDCGAKARTKEWFFRRQYLGSSA